MSRHHRTGQQPRKVQVAANQMQVLQAMYSSLEYKAKVDMSRAATVFTFMLQYMSVTLDVLLDKLDGDNCEFSLKLQNKGRSAMNACNEFIKHFEPLITPDNRDDWNNNYGQFQYAMDNYFCKESDAYQKGSDAARAKEICRAAALRYHDPLEKNPQRNFEAGFREGAAYADLHPIDSVTIKQGDIVKQVPLRELMDAYAEKHNVEVTIELKGEKK